jgi:integral membrane protein
MLGTPIGRLRVVAFVEGCSYLLLLGVAMPLKYLAGLPMAVMIVGSIHGALFVLFCAALMNAMIVARWSMLRGGVAFASSLVPFGTFVLDGCLRREDEDTRALARGMVPDRSAMERVETAMDDRRKRRG